MVIAVKTIKPGNQISKASDKITFETIDEQYQAEKSSSGGFTIRELLNDLLEPKACNRHSLSETSAI